MPSFDAVQLAAWLGIAAFLLALTNQALKLVDRMRGEPGPEQLKGGADILSQRLAVLEGEQREALTRRRLMHEKIDKVETALQAEMKKDVTQVYSELNLLRSDVAGLKRDNEHQNRQLVHIETKLDRLIERNHHP